MAHVEEVTTDLWDASVGAAREAFGDGVTITIDRFHVMKAVQDGLTAARREVQRGVSCEERARLKGSRWLWVTNPEDLTVHQRRELEALAVAFPQLGTIAAQREGLRALFENRGIGSPAEGRRQLDAWVSGVEALGLKALASVCATLRRWRDLIANYFRRRSSNGRVEGFNHGLRSLLWRAYGMVNVENFRLRVLHCFGVSGS